MPCVSPDCAALEAQPRYQDGYVPVVARVLFPVLPCVGTCSHPQHFSATLRHEVDLDQLREALLTVVQETMQPSHVLLWLRPTAPDRQNEPAQLSTPPAR
jgi:hypothetical protein